MSITEVLQGLGGWALELREETPDELREALGLFGHVAVLDGPVDVAAAGDGLLAAARYVGVLRGGEHTLHPEGSGLAAWLGDEDDKGPVLLNRVSYTDQSLDAVVTDLLGRTDAVSKGTVHPQDDPGATYSGEHQYQSLRKVLGSVCAVFGAEYRVNGDGSVDVGTPEQLYGATPSAIITRRGGGADVDLTGMGADFDATTDGYDYSTEVVLLGQTDENRTITTGSATGLGVPYKNLSGGTVSITRLISEAGEGAGTVEQRAQLHLNRFYRAARTVTLDLAEYEMDAPARVGHHVWVHDPDTGLTDNTNEVPFRGEVLHPILERVAAVTWQVRAGMTVAFRTDDGQWWDLTDYVVPGTDADEVTVGDLSGTLTDRDNGIQDRLDGTRGGGAINGVAPNAPTGLALATDVALDSAGRDVPVVTASWTAPTTNTDGSPLTDLSHYTVQWRRTGRTAWEEGPASDTELDLPVAPGLEYEARVRAVDSDGQASSWTGIASITTAADGDAPPVPSDPIVGNYLGQLRIEWDGLFAGAQPTPADLNRVEVHVGTSAGFTPSPSTRIASLNTGGVAYADTPYGATRWARLVAYDHQGNASGPSAAVSGASSKLVGDDVFDGAIGSAALADLAVIRAKIADLAVNDAKIADLDVGKLTAGTINVEVLIGDRLTTAAAGARVEFNSSGIWKYDASETVTVKITDTEVLLTGIYRTALDGERRVEINHNTENGSVRFYAPDGKWGQIRGFTTIEGVEAVQFGMPRLDLTSNGYYNRITFRYDGVSTYRAAQHNIIYTRDSNLGTDTGYFAVQQSAGEGSQGTGVFDSLHMSQDEIKFVQPLAGASFRYSERVVNGDGTVTNWTKFWIEQGQFWFRFHRLDAGDARIAQGNTNGSASPKLILETNAGLGARLRAGYSGANGSRLEARNVADSGYEKMWASSFDVQSTSEVKDNIRDLTAVDTLADRVRPRRYRRLAQCPGQVDEDEIGLVAEEAPPELQAMEGKGVSLYSLATLAFALAKHTRQQARQRITDLEQRVQALENSGA